MEVKIPKTLTQQKTDDEPISLSLSFADIPGHFNFRIKVNQYLERAKAVILVLDSKDKEKISEASEFLYDVLSNRRLVEDRVPILVACNKQDLSMAKKSI